MKSKVNEARVYDEHDWDRWAELAQGLSQDDIDATIERLTNLANYAYKKSQRFGQNITGSKSKSDWAMASTKAKLWARNLKHSKDPQDIGQAYDLGNKMLQNTKKGFFENDLEEDSRDPKPGFKDFFRKFKVGSSVFTPDGAGVIMDRNGGRVLVHLTKDFIRGGAPQSYDVKELELMETAKFLNKLMEGNYRGDLQRLVKSELHIDQHRSKMGEDDDIIVVSFKVKGKDPANDLVSFLETGYEFILDADVSPGEVSPGDFLVFFEISRRTTAPERIYRIVEEVLNLTLQDMDEWEFTYGAPEQRGTRQRFEKHALTIENLKDIIPMSPREYRNMRDEIESDDEEIAALKNIAQIPVNQEAPKDDDMDALRSQAGLL